MLKADDTTGRIVDAWVWKFWPMHVNDVYGVSIGRVALRNTIRAVFGTGVTAALRHRVAKGIPVRAVDGRTIDLEPAPSTEQRGGHAFREVPVAGWAEVNLEVAAF